MKLLQRNRGASLIETMIAVGILGAVAYFVTGMIRNGTMGQRALQSADDARTMTDNIAAILSDPIACGNTFVPGGTATYDPSVGFTVTQVKDGSSSPQVAYQTGNKYSTKALFLDSITVGGSGIDPKSGITKWTPLSSGAGGTAFVQVVWKQANAAQNGGSPQLMNKFFLLNALSMSGTKILSCQAQSAGGGGSLWTKTGANIYNNNSGGVLIGIQVSSVPGAVLDVFSSATGTHTLFVPASGPNQGKLGVGTMTPSATLDVAGPIRAGTANISSACTAPGALASDAISGAPLYCSTPAGNTWVPVAMTCRTVSAVATGSTTVQAACLSNETLMGGGCDCTDASDAPEVKTSAPGANLWKCTFVSSCPMVNRAAYATCCKT